MVRELELQAQTESVNYAEGRRRRRRERRRRRKSSRIPCGDGFCGC